MCDVDQIISPEISDDEFSPSSKGSMMSGEDLAMRRKVVRRSSFDDGGPPVGVYSGKHLSQNDLSRASVNDIGEFWLISERNLELMTRHGTAAEQLVTLARSNLCLVAPPGGSSPLGHQH